MSAESIQNKIVNVHGVHFDISSILNDVTLSIQNNIQRSLDSALKDYELYKSTHDAILQIPFVRDLYIQNQELIYQLNLLEQPIQLKIDEILPPPSPVVMHSYFQLHPNHNETNKKLSHEEESTNTTQSESSTELESSEEDDASAAQESDESDSEEEEEAEEEEAAEEQVEVEEAEEEVYEIVIKNVTYFTTNENDGDIYSCVDGDVGEIVGKFKNKKPVFMKRK